MGKVLHGVPLVKQPGTKAWTPTGETITESYEGRKAEVADKYEEMKTLQRESVNLAEGFLSDRAESSYTLSQEEVAFDNVVRIEWELDRNTYLFPLRTHPVFKNESPYLDDVDAALKTNPVTQYDAIPWTGADPEGDRDTLLKEYYYLKSAGTNSWQYYAYVLRNAWIMTSRDAAQFTSDDIQTVVDIPADTPGPLLALIPEGIEFLKMPADFNEFETGKWEAVQEYWGGTPLWSAIMYPGGTGWSTPGATGKFG